MNVIETRLSGVLIVEPRVFGDERGFFYESYHAERYRDAGIPTAFVQDNLSLSRRGTLRGLHLQHPNGQAKLVSVLQGEVYDAAVDVRVGSPHFGQWTGAVLSAENRRQLYIPSGFAHGFCVLSEQALFSYKCSELYHPECEMTVKWDDPRIGIEWPVDQPLLSAKDLQGVALGSIDERVLPQYSDC